MSIASREEKPLTNLNSSARSYVAHLPRGIGRSREIDEVPANAGTAGRNCPRRCCESAARAQDPFRPGGHDQGSRATRRPERRSPAGGGGGSPVSQRWKTRAAL